MLAQSHARKPAPPLAARGMWLRLHGGADAFGSALGDAVVGSIAKGDGQNASKPLTQAEIDYFLEGTDAPLSPVYGKTFGEDRAARTRMNTPDWAVAPAPTGAGAPDEEQFDFRRESLRANARSAAESQAREDFRRSEITAENAAAKAKDLARQAAAASARNKAVDFVIGGSISGMGPSFADQMGPPLTSSDRVMGVVNRATRLPSSKDLTRDQLMNSLGEVRAAFKYAGSNEEQLALRSAALTLHEAGASRGLMKPGETVGSREFFGTAVASMAFGGSQGTTPASASNGYSGPSFRSGFRSYAVGGDSESAAPTLFYNKFPEHEIDVPSIVPNNRLAGVNGNFNYVVRESGELIVGATGHTSLTGGKPVLAAGEIRLYNGNVKWLDNASGHYQPAASIGSFAEKAFIDQAGLNAAGKFAPKVWEFNPALPRGGKWVKAN